MFESRDFSLNQFQLLHFRNVKFLKIRRDAAHTRNKAEWSLVKWTPREKNQPLRWTLLSNYSRPFFKIINEEMYAGHKGKMWEFNVQGKK